MSFKGELCIYGERELLVELTGTVQLLNEIAPKIEYFKNDEIWDV